MKLENFEDPKDIVKLSEIHKRISEIKSPEEAINFANDIEGWIVGSLSAFSAQYESLNKNWEIICKVTKQDKKCILMVSKIILENKPGYTIIRAISEILTRCGWCVRGVQDFKGCKDCGLAIQCFDDIEYCNECEK